MSSRQPSVLKRAWWRWKSLRLPWRKRWLVGFDLSGNTFWEFKDALNQQRLRRIVKYASKAHFADVRVAPQWVQWLRHTRFDPPTINEQQLDEIRQAQMKQLAAQADARWAAKPSALDKQADVKFLPRSHPPREAAPQDFVRSAQVQELEGDAAKQLAKETPAERQTPIANQAVPQDSVSAEVTTETAKPNEFKGHSMPARPASKPKKTKDFTGYKLAEEGQQQPASWTPQAVRRR